MKVLVVQRQSPKDSTHDAKNESRQRSSLTASYFNIPKQRNTALTVEQGFLLNKIKEIIMKQTVLPCSKADVEDLVASRGLDDLSDYLYDYEQVAAKRN